MTHPLSLARSAGIRLNSDYAGCELDRQRFRQAERHAVDAGVHLQRSRRRRLRCLYRTLSRWCRQSRGTAGRSADERRRPHLVGAAGLVTVRPVEELGHDLPAAVGGAHDVVAKTGESNHPAVRQRCRGLVGLARRCDRTARSTTSHPRKTRPPTTLPSGRPSRRCLKLEAGVKPRNGSVHHLPHNKREESPPTRCRDVRLTHHRV